MTAVVSLLPPVALFAQATAWDRKPLDAGAERKLRARVFTTLIPE
jgi:hypothetical protein